MCGVPEVSLVSARASIVGMHVINGHAKFSAQMLTIPIVLGSPTCTGPPCAAGTALVMLVTLAICFKEYGLIETTIVPENGLISAITCQNAVRTKKCKYQEALQTYPTAASLIDVLYIGTLRCNSTCLGTSLQSSGVNE